MRLIAAACAGFCLLLSPYGASAIWAELTETQLIEESDLIVTGTMIGRTRLVVRSEKATSAGSVELQVGVVQVETVFKGDPQQRVALLALPAPTPGIHNSDVMTYTAGQTGLWYFRLRSPGEIGIFLADHPQRFVTIEQAGDQLESLRNLVHR